MNIHEVPLVDLKLQYESLKPDIDEAILRVMASGRYIGGPETEAFEQEFASYCGTAHCVAVGSGTAALNLTLRALGVGPGDEVATCAFTISATLDAICDLGARPVLVDASQDSYTLDPGQIERVLSERTRAILPVHIYGQPSDMKPIVELADAHGIPVVSDACEAHGAQYCDRPVTTYGTASCFSFYPTKNLAAYGDSGAVVTDNPDLADQLRHLRYHGWERRFYSTVSSMNSRMDEIQAAILRTKLPHLEEWNGIRAAIASGYTDLLRESDFVPAPDLPWAKSANYVYVIQAPHREAVRSALRDAGVATDVHWPSLPHQQPAFRHLGYGEGSFPVAEELVRRVLTVPLFPEMSEGQEHQVREALDGLAHLSEV